MYVLERTKSATRTLVAVVVNETTGHVHDATLANVQRASAHWFVVGWIHTQRVLSSKTQQLLFARRSSVCFVVSASKKLW